MSERVELELEATARAAELWVRQGVLSINQTHAILKKRRGIEFALARKIPVVQDFERAIKYELALLKLVERAASEKKSDWNKARQPVLSRLHGLFSRTLRRFNDLELWNQYFDFCVAQGSTRAASKAFARALELFPNQVELWMRAAVFSADQMGDIQGALALLQRGIRFNPLSQELHLALFKTDLVSPLGSLESCKTIYSHAVKALEESRQDSPAARARYLAVLTSLFGDVRNEIHEWIIQDVLSSFSGSLEAVASLSEHLDFQEALDLWKQLPNQDPLVRESFIQFLYSRDRFGDVIASIDSNQELTPRELRCLISSHLSLGRREEALELLDGSCVDDEELTRLRQLLSGEEESPQDSDEAKNEFNQALFEKNYSKCRSLLELKLSVDSACVETWAGLIRVEQLAGEGKVALVFQRAIRTLSDPESVLRLERLLSTE